MPGEDQPGVVHLGAYDGEELLSACLIFPEPCPWLPGEHAWRLRGMATDEASRGTGIGARVLRAALDHVRASGGRLVWCNAREGAVRFYEREGFAATGVGRFDPELGLGLVEYARAV